MSAAMKSTAAAILRDLSTDPVVGHDGWHNRSEIINMVARRISAAVVEGVDIGALLERMRADGWYVAIHNDYVINGKRHTFWLFTHPDGRWVRGEAATDSEALGECIEAASPN